MIINEVIQQFIDWTKKKIHHHCDEVHRELYFREKEIWWVALGKNVGYEMDGKHKHFSRPVLILKKFSSEMCFILPLTSRIRPDNLSYQFVLNWDGKKSAMNFSQGRAISSKRLMDKAGMIDSANFENVIKSFLNYFSAKK